LVFGSSPHVGVVSSYDPEKEEEEEEEEGFFSITYEDGDGEELSPRELAVLLDQAARAGGA
jgi:hypothetical protein